MASERKQAEFDQFASDLGDELGKELEAAIGAPTRVAGPSLAILERGALVGTGEAIAHTACSAGDESADRIDLVQPLPDAVTLGALMLGLDAEAVLEQRAGGLDGELLEAYGKCVEATRSVLARLLEGAGLPAVHAEAPVSVANASADEGWLDADRYHRIRYEIAFPHDLPGGSLDVLLPLTTDEKWFGPLDADAASGGAAESPEQRLIVVVDPNGDDRDAAEALEDEIGCTMWALEPAEFGFETLDEIGEALAVIVEWDLGGHCGLDLLETLLRDERTRDIPVLLASAAPTGPMVTAAIRAGARSFVAKPYDPDEVSSRLSGAGCKLHT